MPPKAAAKKDEQRVPWGESQTSLLVSACLDHLLLNRTTFYAVEGLEPWRAHGSDAINKQLQKFLKGIAEQYKIPAPVAPGKVKKESGCASSPSTPVKPKTPAKPRTTPTKTVKKASVKEEKCEDEEAEDSDEKPFEKEQTPTPATPSKKTPAKPRKAPVKAAKEVADESKVSGDEEEEDVSNEKTTSVKEESKPKAPVKKRSTPAKAPKASAVEEEESDYEGTADEEVVKTPVKKKEPVAASVKAKSSAKKTPISKSTDEAQPAGVEAIVAGAAHAIKAEAIRPKPKAKVAAAKASSSKSIGPSTATAAEGSNGISKKRPRDATPESASEVESPASSRPRRTTTKEVDYFKMANGEELASEDGEAEEEDWGLIPLDELQPGQEV